MDDFKEEWPGRIGFETISSGRSAGDVVAIAVSSGVTLNGDRSIPEVGTSREHPGVDS